MQEIYYTDEMKTEILKNANSQKLALQGITQAMGFSLYDLLARQLNELQRLNSTMESILEVTLRERGSQ